MYCLCSKENGFPGDGEGDSVIRTTWASPEAMGHLERIHAMYKAPSLLSWSKVTGQGVYKSIRIPIGIP